MTKTSFIVTCQDNPNTVFGVAESRKEAESLVNDCVDAARDNLSNAHYEHLLENGLSSLDRVEPSAYASEGEVSQISPDNYVISEVLVGQPTEVNVLPLPEPDEEDDDDECSLYLYPGDGSHPDPDDTEGDPEWDEDEAEVEDAAEGER